MTAKKWLTQKLGKQVMNKTRPNIGQGLDALFGITETSNNISGNIEKNITYVSVNHLVKSQNQPRDSFDINEINNLANSIKEHGIIQPLLVRHNKDEEYEVIAGERRWRAAIIAGLKTIPVIIKNLNDKDAMAIALVENLQREDLNPIEEAYGIQKLFLNFGLTHEKIAKSIGKSRSTVSNILRLLELDENIKKLLREKKIDMGHARALLGLEKEIQAKLVHEIIQKELTVRQTEKLVQNLRNPKKITLNTNIDRQQIALWKQNLSKKVPVEVSIKINNEGKSRVIISLDSIEDINWFIENISFNNKEKI